MVSLADFVRNEMMGALSEISRRPADKAHEELVRQDHLRAEGIENATAGFRVMGMIYLGREVWVNGWSRDRSEVAAIELKRTFRKPTINL